MYVLQGNSKEFPELFVPTIYVFIFRGISHKVGVLNAFQFAVHFIYPYEMSIII